MKRKFYLATICVCVVLYSTTLAFADYKIKQRMTMQGQTIETTILVKGSRQRSSSGGGMMGMGVDVSTIEQCDLKRNVQINDGKKLYFIEPFSDSTDAATMDKSEIRNPKSQIQKGGTVTMTYNITDTGERKTMFGLTARHLKTVMTMQASPDACTDNDMRIETDGWYIDLPSFSCPVQPPRNPIAGMGGGRGGCQDKFVIKQSGSGKLGFPLAETRTMKMGDDDEDAMSFTQSVETVEFSSQPLDAALFDVPKDYQLAKSSQDLYGKPDMSQMTRGMNNSSGDGENSVTSANTKPAAKKAGTIRIGVLGVSNKSSESVSTENLRSVLIQKLSGGNVEAVAINSETDAKAMSCDYILTTDVSKLKQSAASKIGGMFGKVTNTDTSATLKFEAQIDFKLTTADRQTILQNKAVQKSEGAAQTVAEATLAQAAQQVLSKIKN